MSALLTENLPLLAGAPNGIKKLRELILDLAVRGKLLPQNPSDEPASELLKRIAEKKARLVAEGKIRKQKTLMESTEEDKPFALPVGWAWTRLGELGLVGSSSRVHQKDWQSSGVPFYRAREIVRLSREGFVDNDLFISEELFEELSRKGLGPATGDIMITGVGTIGIPYCVKESDRFYFKDASVLIFKNYALDDTSYLLKYLVSPLWVTTIHKESMGTTVHTLTIARASETLCPLPPLAEQQRIVAKVDELMALCDRLDAQQADAESAHTRLVQALLDSLTQASDTNDFGASWQRLAEHFHTLFTTESSIGALKQTLLKLSVMGKLVPQDPSDEPASELLKRIDAEKQRLVAEGQLKKQKPCPDITEDEKSFESPPGWHWVRVGEAFQVISGGTFDKVREQDSGAYLYVKVGDMNMTSNELEIKTSSRFIDPVEKELRGLIPVNSIIFPKRGGAIATNKKRIVRNAIFADLNIMAITPFNHISIEYSYLWLSGVDLAELNTGTSVPQINHKDIEPLLFPLPPLKEQHRIVAKVDQLMALCDQLKTHLTQARQLNEQLSSTLVAQAVA